LIVRGRRVQIVSSPLDDVMKPGCILFFQWHRLEYNIIRYTSASDWLMVYVKVSEGNSIESLKLIFDLSLHELQTEGFKCI
jgi:hypothetical protein